MKESTSVDSLINSNKINKAEEMFLRWMDRYPNDYHALGNYADLMMKRANHGLSVHLYLYLMKAWKDMPKDYLALMWANIGQALLIERHDKEAEVAFKKAIKENDKEPGIYNAMGACYINQSQPDKVIEWCNKALELQPDMRQPLWNRSIGYLEKSMWAEAWPGYEEGDRKTIQRSYKEGDQMRKWDGKRNRTVVAWGEQGLGDEVMFGTCLVDFIENCKNPIIDCHPRLEKTFKRTFPGIPIYGTRKTSEITWHHKHKIDSQISIASLPSLYRNSADKFPGKPYLKADPERIKHYREKLEQLTPKKITDIKKMGPFIGITWFGGEKKTRFDYRAIPLDKWGPILNTGCVFVSLQYNKWGHKKDAIEMGIPHWDEPIEDLDEQMALIMACDLVISVCQTVVHFSGALGKKCWCLTPSRPAWRYGVEGDHMAWYGETVELIRQQEGDTWEPVLEETAKKLIEFKERYESVKSEGIEGVSVARRGGVERVAEGQRQSG